MATGSISGAIVTFSGDQFNYASLVSVIAIPIFIGKEFCLSVIDDLASFILEAIF